MTTDPEATRAAARGRRRLRARRAWKARLQTWLEWLDAGAITHAEMRQGAARWLEMATR